MPTDLIKKLAIADDFDDGLNRKVIDRVQNLISRSQTSGLNYLILVRDLRLC